MSCKAPDIAPIKAFCEETGMPRAEAYRLVKAHKLPHIRAGEVGIRILMPAFRRMVAGEPIPAELLPGR